MSQSSTPGLHMPQLDMKKKIIVALLIVVIGHMGVLWAVSQMKAPELKPVEKKPIKVKLVTIGKAPPPPPPPKEKVKPKEVKIVKKAEAPPAKEIKKIQSTKLETPKSVTQPMSKPPVQAPVIASVTGNKPVATPMPEATPEPVRAAPTPVVTAPAVKNVSIGSGGIQWQRTPSFKLSASELRDGGCNVSVLINANEKGMVTSAVAKSSSCSPAVTRKITSAVKSAKFKPYTENGVAYPIVAQQPFDLK